MALASEIPILLWVSWNGVACVEISDEGLETLGLRLLSGRWFRPEDEALDWTPAVIDQEASRALFGDQDPLGRVIGDSPVFGFDQRDEYEPPGPDRVRVVGVVESCFYYGKFGHGEVEVPGFVFLRISQERLLDLAGDTNTFYLLVHSHAGAEPAFGEALKSRIQGIFPADQSIRFEVKSLAAVEEEDRAFRLRMLGRIARISGLMMFVVALGLIGMMWQSVRRRTREIGIRRAVGAPGVRACGQFLGEWAVLVTVAIALGCVSIVQFGLLDKVDMVLWSQLPAPVAAAGVGATALVLYLAVLAVRTLSGLGGGARQAGRGPAPRLKGTREVVMLKNYTKMALKVLLRRKLFTCISLFTISFTLMVLMVAASLFDHVFGSFPPETRSDRTLLVSSMRGEHDESPGYQPPGAELRLPRALRLAPGERGEGLHLPLDHHGDHLPRGREGGVPAQVHGRGVLGDPRVRLPRRAPLLRGGGGRGPASGGDQRGDATRVLRGGAGRGQATSS